MKAFYELSERVRDVPQADLKVDFGGAGAMVRQGAWARAWACAWAWAWVCVCARCRPRAGVLTACPGVEGGPGMALAASREDTCGCASKPTP